MLKKIAKRVNKEIEQAEDYCQQAMLVKTKSAQTADLFATLCSEELDHAEKLLREGQRLITVKDVHSYDSKEKEAASDAWHEKCKTIWEWEQRIANERISEIRFKLSEYRGM